MLRTYGDKAVAIASGPLVATCQPCPDWERAQARTRGECRAWIEHDAYFMWQARLSNTFEELRQWVKAQARTLQHISTWQELRDLTVTAAVSHLQQYNPTFHAPNPSFLTDGADVTWWMYAAIVSECDYRTGQKLNGIQPSGTHHGSSTVHDCRHTDARTRDVR